MKQKRKVKSLISSNGENKNLLTALLFLVGGVLFCGALALFASIGGVASAENSDVIEYPGIDDKKEVLLRFGLIDEGGTTAVNEMFLTGKAFYVNGNAGLSVDGASDMSLGAGKYINFLGGKTDGSNIDSNNVTIIGGNQVKILENNDNTSFLGGSSNTVNPGNDSVSPVMLGGQNNTIGSNQEGSAIIGGRNNEIGGSTSYDFVIGGENNNIGSNSKNAIVGGARVTVNGGNSNLFVFSAGSEFNPKGGNAFYLNVQHGLGLNKAASDLSENNLGVDSNGAVSFGPIDITSSARKCTSDDYGVQGSFEGCLVGCTKLGADNGGKWEMVDHGDKCRDLCKTRSSYCIMSPIEPAKPDPYTSYCTTNGVDTGHAHHCGGEALVLPNYQNVLFETKLIDSDDSCPKPGTANWTENRCVFKCDGEYHLTGDQTGMGGRTKCYKDCKLPWDGTKIKHNETRIAYNTDETYCAFPSGSPASPHTCANHKKTIICQNGTLYLQKSNGQADTAHPAITDGYVYSGCMLHQYRCNTDVYNYSASDITSSSKFNDTVTTWSLSDRATISGKRGKYMLCIDYNTNPNTVQQLNGEKCDPLNLNTSVNPKRYTTHYKWVGCQTNYHTGAGYETVCMEDCTLKKTNNQVQYYRHNTTVVGYKTKQETCTSKCESATLVCNDGKWRLGSLNGTQTTAYVYNDCTLKDYTCASRYNVTETEKQAHESTSIYGNLCVPYKANNTDKVTCTAQSTKYELTDCKSGYHTVNGKRCVSNYKEVNCNTSSVWKPDNAHFNVVSVGVYWKSSCGRKGSDATCWESPVDCDWGCDTNYHQEGSNLCCHDGEHSDGGTCTSNTSSAQCIEAGGVANSHYVVENVSITYNEATGTWSTPRNCNWECDEGYTRNGNKCDEIPDPVDGVCDYTEGTHYNCIAGTPTGKTEGDAQYLWTCEGINEGSDASCSTPKKINGQCLNNSHYNCIAGTSKNHVDGTSAYTRDCVGSNGGTTDNCIENKAPVNGLCASLKDECMKGDFEDVTDTTTDYKWNCVGSNGGTTDNCSIDKCEAKGCYRTDQECNEANGHSGPGTVCYTDDDECYCHGTINGICSTTVDECEVGIYEDVDDTSTQFKRNCLGSNGGGDAHCSKSCPDGQTIQNGECKSSAITINICPYAIYNHGVNGQCYTNETLDDVVYVATAPLPTDVSITAGFTYKSWGGDTNGGNPVCNYSSSSKSTVYTISAGSTESEAPSGGHSDALHRWATAHSVTVGYESYFETSFTSSINKTSYTSSTGQEYNFVLYTAPCGVSYRDQDPECGGTHYNCAVGTPGATNEGDTSYTWKCTNGLSSVDCSEAKKINGQCFNGSHYNCRQGTAANPTPGSAGWTWTCEGINGGQSDSCYENCPAGQTIQNGACVMENHYYLSFGLITHNEQVSRGTEIIIYVKDENGNASSIPDDSLTIEADALSTNCGVNLNPRFDVGNNSNGSTAHSIPVCLLYELEDIIFPEDQEDGDVEVLDDTTAKKGSNIYEIVGFYAVAGNCGKASKDAEYSVVKPTENLCSAGAPSEVTLGTNTNGSLYWQWTCMGSPEKTCTIGIPSAVFDYCNQGSTLTVDYSPYYGGNVLYPYGVIIGGSSHTEQMYNCTSKPCTISNSNVSEITSLKYNGTTLEGYPVYEVKNGVTLVKGNYDSSLCSSPSITCSYKGNSYSVGDTITTYTVETAATCTPIVSKCLSSGSWDKTPGNYTTCQTCYGELKFNIANHGMRDVVVLSYTWWDASGIEHISPFIECEGQEDTIIRSDHGDAICSIGEIPCGSYNGGYINYQYYPYSTDPHVISTDAINLDESGKIYYMITIDD